MSDEQLIQIIKQNLPEKLGFSSEGGLNGKCIIQGTLEDVLKFARRMISTGYCERMEEQRHYDELNMWND
jgi:hypothetical protein